MNLKVFLSYRRHASTPADRLFRDLVNRFGNKNVFKDVDALWGGTDYEVYLQQALANCDVFVIMIDPYWAIDTSGRNRLQDPNDWVRREIETALARSAPIIPVPLENSRLPAASALPSSLLPFRRLQTVPLRETSWNSDTGRIIAFLDRVAVERAGGKPSALVEGGTPLSRRKHRSSLLITPGSRIRIASKVTGQIPPNQTGLPFPIVAAQGQTGTVLRIDGRSALVRWDPQEWAKSRLGFFGGSKVLLDTFETRIAADWLEPLDPSE